MPAVAVPATVCVSSPAEPASAAVVQAAPLATSLTWIRSDAAVRRPTVTKLAVVATSFTSSVVLVDVTVPVPTASLTAKSVFAVPRSAYVPVAVALVQMRPAAVALPTAALIEMVPTTADVAVTAAPAAISLVGVAHVPSTIFKKRPAVLVETPRPVVVMTTSLAVPAVSGDPLVNPVATAALYVSVPAWAVPTAVVASLHSITDTCRFVLVLAVRVVAATAEQPPAVAVTSVTVPTAAHVAAVAAEFVAAVKQT